MAASTGWFPGKSANANYQRAKIAFTAGVGGTDTATLDFMSGELIKVFIDVNTLKVSTSTIIITNDDGEELFHYTAPVSPVDVTYYPMQDGGVNNQTGALTTKNSTPQAFVGRLTVALASANQNDNPIVYVTVRK